MANRWPLPRKAGGPETILVVLLIVYLSWQVLVPIAGLIFSSLKDVRPADATYLSPNLTFDNYREVLGTGRLWQVTWTTVVFALSSSALAMMMGAFLAWITTRTNAPFRKIVASLVLYQLAVPELLAPISWTYLFGPRAGLLNQWWMQLTGAQGPLFNIYSLPGMIWVESFLLLPLVYLFAVPAMSALDRSLEEAAELSGASLLQVSRDIVLKLAAPALAATFIIVLVRSWEAFEVPWYLGLRQGQLTYATQIYFSTVTPPSDTGLIASYALPMLAVAVMLVLWYGRFDRGAARYAVLTGRSYRQDVRALTGKVRGAVGGIALALVLFGILLPLLMLAWMSLLPFYQPPSVAALKGITADAYTRVFTDDDVLLAFKNSLIVGMASSLLILTVATLSAWFSLRTKVRGRWLINKLTFLPMSIPNIVVGICFLWLFLLLPVNLSGSYLALIIAYFTIFVAIGARNVYAQVMQIHPELDEAARMSGASLFTSLRTVTVPMLAPALLASLLYIVVWAFKELPNALLLSSPQTKTAAALMFDLTAVGTIADFAAIGLVTVVFLMIVLRVFQTFARKYGLRGF